MKSQRSGDAAFHDVRHVFTPEGVVPLAVFLSHLDDLIGQVQVFHLLYGKWLPVDGCSKRDGTFHATWSGVPWRIE